MNKKNYFEPDINIVLLVSGDVLAFSNDESKYNDSENHFADNYF